MLHSLGSLPSPSESPLMTVTEVLGLIEAAEVLVTFVCTLVTAFCAVATDRNDVTTGVPASRITFARVLAVAAEIIVSTPLESVYTQRSLSASSGTRYTPSFPPPPEVLIGAW